MPKGSQLHHVIGKKIAAIRLNPFRAGDGRGIAYAPEIVLEDGSILSFSTQETDVDRYGTTIRITQTVDLTAPAPDAGRPFKPRLRGTTERAEALVQFLRLNGGQATFSVLLAELKGRFGKSMNANHLIAAMKRIPHTKEQRGVYHLVG